MGNRRHVFSQAREKPSILSQITFQNAFYLCLAVTRMLLDARKINVPMEDRLLGVSIKICREQIRAGMTYSQHSTIWRQKAIAYERRGEPSGNRCLQTAPKFFTLSWFTFSFVKCASSWASSSSLNIVILHCVVPVLHKTMQEIFRFLCIQNIATC